MSVKWQGPHNCFGETTHPSQKRILNFGLGVELASRSRAGVGCTPSTLPPCLLGLHTFFAPTYALRGDSKGLIELLGGAVHPYKTFSSTACHNTLTLMWVRPASCRAGIFRLRLIPFVVTPTLRTPFNELSARTISGRSFRTSGC